MVEGSEEAAALAREVSTAARAAGRRLAVAESLTGGALSTALASAPHAGEWYAGGVIAYQVATKQRVLGVTTDAVVTDRCAIEMARGVREVLAADVFEHRFDGEPDAVVRAAIRATIAHLRDALRR